MRLIDDLFEMGGGYVLDFSNRTFDEFFRTEFRVNIYAPRYAAEGESKAKRLRYFLKISDTPTRLRTLAALWEYRQAVRRRSKTEEWVPDAAREFRGLIERLGGNRPPQTEGPSSTAIASPLEPVKVDALKVQLLAVSQLEPHARGYEWERFLGRLFALNGLGPRASFHLTGEQIDGSFELAGETYLLEAKWVSSPIGAGELRAFNGKVEEMAAWSRGLFVSESGFTEGGLQAFGRGKRVVCMDGLDIFDMLDRGLQFSDVMARKVRRAAETGNIFARVRDLYD